MSVTRIDSRQEIDLSTNSKADGFTIPEQIALSSRIKAGDRQAFAHLIAGTQRALYALIWRLLRSHEETNDILQDTYLRLYERRNRVDTSQPIVPYLRRIAVNLALNRLKKVRRQVGLEDMLADARDSCIEARTETAEMLDLAAKAISGLPEKQQLVLLLRVQENMSYQEIADALGIRIGTVMSRLARARERIIDQLEKAHRLPKMEWIQ